MSSVAGLSLAGARVALAAVSAVADILPLLRPRRLLGMARLLVLAVSAVGSAAASVAIVVDSVVVEAAGSIVVLAADTAVDAAVWATKVIADTAVGVILAVAIGTEALRMALLLDRDLEADMAVGMTTAAAPATLTSSHSLPVADTVTATATTVPLEVGMLDRSVLTTEVGMTSRARAVATEQAVTRRRSTHDDYPKSPPRPIDT